MHMTCCERDQCQSKQHLSIFINYVFTSWDKAMKRSCLLQMHMLSLGFVQAQLPWAWYLSWKTGSACSSFTRCTHRATTFPHGAAQSISIPLAQASVTQMAHPPQQCPDCFVEKGQQLTLCLLCSIHASTSRFGVHSMGSQSQGQARQPQHHTCN